MKKCLTLFTVAIAAIALAISCEKIVEEPQNVTPVNHESEQITITVAIPNGLTKVSLTQDPDDADGAIKLAWESTDKILVINAEDASKSEEFSIASIDSQKPYLATFTGKHVEGSTFNILYGAESVSAAKTYNPVFTQSGNASTAHLQFLALLEGVSSYESIEFSQSWASAKGGSFKQNSALRMRLQLPDDIENVKQVSLIAAEDIFGGSDRITVSFENAVEPVNHIIAAYAMLPLGDAIETSDCDYDVVVSDDNGVEYKKTFSPGSISFKPGVTNAIKLNKSGFERQSQFAGGTGVEGDPWLIATPDQMLAMKENLRSGETKYFKLIEDIDMDGIEWSPLNDVKNSDGIYDQSIDLDGNNHSISNLDHSLFYVLSGSVHDLTLEDAVISDGNQRGVLAQYVQGTDNVINNVDVNNGNVGAGSGNMGGLIGRINSGSDGSLTATIQDCDITNTSVKGPVAGGLIGSVEAEVEISNCTVSANSSGTSSVEGSASNIGGLVGNITKASSITDCVVSGTDVTGVGVVGGVIGFANALITMSGCTYTGGAVSATARYCGGMVASVANYASVLSDCHVADAKITSSSDRFGGFAGLINTKVQVKGCTVGTSSQRVIVNSTQTAATANVGGFAGCNYGKISKNDGIRSNAFVTVSSSNVTAGNKMNIGGFVGYNTGTIEYCDADVDMTNLTGQYIGGFCGIILQSGKIQYCTETGSVSGNNYTGGFVGAVDSANASFTECSSAGSVSAASSIGGFAGGCTAKDKSATFTGNSSSATVTSNGSNYGGFIGNCVGSLISNHATGNVTSTGGGNGGGFAGGVWEASTGTVFSKNFATGSVSGNTNLGGLIGYIGGNLTMSDCYATGAVGNSTKYNQKYGGLVGYTSDNAEYITTGVSIINCYASGNVESSFASGGLIGRLGLSSCSISNCAAWNSVVNPHSVGSENWSSGAVIGVAFPTSTLTDNYRNPNMVLTAYWVPSDMTSFQHANVSSSHPLTDSTGVEMGDTATAKGQAHYPQYPYHGKVDAEKTLSQLASTTLGWSSDVWDFSGELPTLK